MTTVPRTYGLHIAPRLAGGLKRAVLAPLLADPPAIGTPAPVLAPVALVPGGAVLATSEHVPAHHRPATQRRRRVLHALRPTETKIIFFVVLALNLTIGAYLSLVHSVSFEDALTKVYQAGSVVRSNDPHLGAIGFVFGPLPTLVMLPFVWLGEIWPALLSRGFLANMTSAFATAGAAAVLRGILYDLGVGRLVRLLLVAALVGHPLVLYYGGSGMSELMLVFLLLVAARGLLRWMEGVSGPAALMGVGLALGGAYLVRLESLGAGLAVMALVPLVTVVRRWRDEQRLAYALNDLALVGAPILGSFFVFALASKLLVGAWLPTVTSIYGNAALVASRPEFVTDRAGTTVALRFGYAIDQVAGLEPQLLTLVAAALIVSVLRRDARILGLLACFAPILAANIVFTADLKTFAFLRFMVTAIPLAVLMGAVIASRSRRPRAGRRAGQSAWVPRLHPELGRNPLGRPRWDRALAWSGALATLIILGLSVPSAVSTMQDDRLAIQEAGPLRALLEPERASAEDFSVINAFGAERAVAAYLDSKELPDGSVVADAANAFAIFVASKDPSQFVMTADRQFERTVADPVRFGARYLLVPESAGNFDALLAEYPSLYKDGAGIGQLEREFPKQGAGVTWRLYRLAVR